MLKALNFSLCLFLVSSVALADNPKDRFASFPFSLSLDMDIVYEITASKPKDLLNIINRHGVKVHRVVTKSPKKQLNPILANLEVASDVLVRDSEFEESYEGRMLLRANPCCNLTQDILLIRDTASNYTLIHEFLHFALHTEIDPKWKDTEMNFILAMRRLNIYKKSLFFEPNNLLNPIWRRDVLNAEKDLLEMLFVRFQMGQSQEAIIEKVLSRYIDPSSPYFDSARKKEGHAYGEAMINNIIDLYGALFESITWTKNTVTDYDTQIRSKSIKLQAKDSLTMDQAKSFLQASNRLLKELDPIRAEIERLKAFYLAW
ncbi:MAG: hypothetical protein JNM39_12375 [Bdellovibrionaceae bacterium]|nr:hypothetical protein [Pseudobdellovibrionaceae bacterium]